MRFLFLIFFFQFVLAINFPWESIQLTEAEAKANPSLSFGDTSLPIPAPSPNTTICKIYPGETLWPSPQAWALLNSTLSGALIQPLPLASACYPKWFDATKCDYVKSNWGNSSLHTFDPASIVSQWLEGNTCPLPDDVKSARSEDCTASGFPAYVVNATTVRDVQVAVNFARNNGIRLIIKNTGHSFLGQSTGSGSLSIWTRHLQGFTYLPSLSLGAYSGPAAFGGAGMQNFEVQREMAVNNITVVTPGGSTVGAFGGFMMGGGHSTFTSYYGLGSDQILGMNVVLADGRFVSVRPGENEDLLWAIRGGGAGTWGVITSVITRVYPSTPITTLSLAFSTHPLRYTANPLSQTSNATTLINMTMSRDTFWAGMAAYWRFSLQICTYGGIGWNFIRHEKPLTNSSEDGLLFHVSFSMPNLPPSAMNSLTAPFIEELRSLGINLPAPNAFQFPPRSANFPPTRPGDGVSGTRFATRLFPRENFQDPKKLNETNDAIRRLIEAGYLFHGLNYAPTTSVAGISVPPYLPDNAVNPAFRKTVLHGEGFDVVPVTSLSAGENAVRYRRFREAFEGFVNTSEGAGAYMNEADVEEPNWQQAFYGSNYAKLLKIQKKRDPWGLFWMPKGVGSEGWGIKLTGGGGTPTQNGRLCRV
ncbi:hypothetical protein BGZ60DRAFT_387156 [Tricladium varicosporioides]|nr:hypothetical protein BGZ60DRAFT_387156 [Hymenoscyphus varicosporioides]